MFILDSLMISGIRWALETALTAAEAEMNDDSVLREQLLEAEMRREMGEITDEEFADIEADLLARIREIKERREGGSGPIDMGAPSRSRPRPDSRFQVEASVSGDFYDPADAPHTTIVETSPVEGEHRPDLRRTRDHGPRHGAGRVEPFDALRRCTRKRSSRRNANDERPERERPRTTRTSRTSRTSKLTK